MKVKIIYYNFTPEEVSALYKLIIQTGWIPRDESITNVVNRICKIAEANELATRDNQTT